MNSLPADQDEKNRLAALHSYHILDTLEEKDFDDLTALAAAICQVPIALISLVDENRQWFKSHRGIDISETPIEQSFCAHAIVSANEIMIVEDAHEDNRFKENPLVTGQPNITFYAGVPLVNEDGYSLGTLCIIDQHKKVLTAEQQQALQIIARQVMDKMELRKKVIVLEAANEALRKSKQTIEQLNEDLSISNERISTLIEQAPVSIIVFRGEDLVIEAVNPPMLQLLNKEADILHKPLLEVIPELDGQEAFNLLYKVLKTGESVYSYDTPVVLHRAGKQTVGYFNFSYTPMIENGVITGVIDMAVEVSNQVAALKALENTQDKMNMALESAELGVWTAEIASDVLFVSDRGRAIHGLSPDITLTLARAVEMIPEEYRKKVVAGIQDAISSKANFSAEYPISPMDGSPQRWLKANGKAYYDEEGNPLYITGTMLDITEQMQDELRKNDFISMVSHELKTPLTSITGYIQVLLHKARRNDDVFAANALEKANKQAGKMTTMINGFLNVSRLESGKIHIDKHLFNMADLVKESEEETLSIITSHTIIYHPVEPTFVNADWDKIGHVISNFISNAVKYSPAGTSINVACITVGGMAQVSVKDEGMGISQQDMSKLFERYYRVEGKQTKTIAGFGIGLYLCAEIIERHAGKIWVESVLGKGSAFYFSLPLADQ